MFVAAAIVLAMVFMVFTASAKADVSFVGIGATGVDPYGNPWTWNTTTGAGFPGVAGIPRWGDARPPPWPIDLERPPDVYFDFVLGTA